MIKSFTITNHQNETLHLILTEPEKAGVAVASVEGLNPPKINVNTVDMANLDGSIFTSSRADARNIVFQLIMMEGIASAKSIEDSRHLVYRYFPIKHQIRIEVETDRRTSVIWGYVESNETYIFSKQEYAQISIVCPDPWFYDVNDRNVRFYAIEPLFEFPFSNESLTEDLINFGEIKLDTSVEFIYTGDVDTGLEMTIHATGPVENIVLYDRTTQQAMNIDTAKIEQVTGIAFGDGDDIIISTMKGAKYARMLHEGETYNIIAALAKNSEWFQITQGSNIIAFSAEKGQENLEFAVSYHLAYGGI